MYKINYLKDCKIRKRKHLIVYCIINKSLCFYSTISAATCSKSFHYKK